MDATVECDGAGNGTDLDAWLASNGGASATDACSGVTWSNDFDALSADCGATGAATVTFTATDDCGNATSTTATFTIEDTTAPAVWTRWTRRLNATALATQPTSTLGSPATAALRQRTLAAE